MNKPSKSCWLLGCDLLNRTRATTSTRGFVSVYRADGRCDLVTTASLADRVVAPFVVEQGHVMARSPGDRESELTESAESWRLLQKLLHLAEHVTDASLRPRPRLHQNP
jgi:hypothetical protein